MRNRSANASPHPRTQSRRRARHTSVGLSLVLPIRTGFTRLQRDIELKTADFSERTLAITKLEARLSRRTTMNSKGPTASAYALRPKALG